MSRKEIADIEVVADRAAPGEKQGFLKLRRLRLRNRYTDGSRSAEYACDIVSRPGVDAVTVVLFQRQPDGRVLVGLRENLRAPVFLRRGNPAVLFPETPPLSTILETVAGILEPDDGEHGLDRALRLRASAEAAEEVGIPVPPERILDLGGAAFPTPGVADEKVYFKAAEVDLAQAHAPEGDGSVMEEVGGLVVLPLDEAIARCRSGSIPDMKTEIALVRLRDQLA